MGAGLHDDPRLSLSVPFDLYSAMEIYYRVEWYGYRKS
jgi:hypothetical protein